MGPERRVTTTRGQEDTCIPGLCGEPPHSDNAEVQRLGMPLVEEGLEEKSSTCSYDQREACGRKGRQSQQEDKMMNSMTCGERSSRSTSKEGSIQLRKKLHLASKHARIKPAAAAGANGKGPQLCNKRPTISTSTQTWVHRCAGGRFFIHVHERAHVILRIPSSR